MMTRVPVISAAPSVRTSGLYPTRNPTLKIGLGRIMGNVLEAGSWDACLSKPSTIWFNPNRRARRRSLIFSVREEPGQRERPLLWINHDLT